MVCFIKDLHGLSIKCKGRIWILQLKNDIIENNSDETSSLRKKGKSRTVFGSHNFHEITMAYPMRYARTWRYKLIHNINYWTPFPIDQDFYLSPTFQDLLQRTYNNQSLHWYKPSLRAYYQRPEYELFDLKVDPEERYNVAEKPNYKVCH